MSVVHFFQTLFIQSKLLPISYHRVPCLDGDAAAGRAVGSDKAAETLQGDMDGCTAEERICGRGVLVWHPLELLRLTALEKHKKGIVNRLRNGKKKYSSI